MIRPCGATDFETILAIVNQAAEAYRGVIPPDRWHEPYMPADELEREIAAGVEFAAYADGSTVAGVMGCQPVKDVILIRHAYVRPSHQRSGVGGALLRHWLETANRPVLIGTWAAASWAVDFYLRHGFTLIQGTEKDRLLRRYWSIPARQVETSVVLADPVWAERNPVSG